MRFDCIHCRKATTKPQSGKGAFLRMLTKIKEREREKLLSDEGLKYRSQRPQDVEAVFGNLKNNKQFKRFHLRGLKKVEIEFGLLAIAHNLAKIAS